MKLVYSKYIQHLNQILKLRFGLDSPPENSIALFSRGTVSKYQKIILKHRKVIF